MYFENTFRQARCTQTFSNGVVPALLCSAFFFVESAFVVAFFNVPFIS